MNRLIETIDQATRSRKTFKAAVAVLVVVIFALIGVLFWQVHQNGEIAASNAAVARARGQALGTANAKLTQNGIPAVKPTNEGATPGQTDVGPTTPSSTPKAEPGQPGAKGETGATGATGATGPGPTTAQVTDAVENYCDAHSDCTSGPTKAQVAAAVMTYCTGDTCKGVTGPTGATGKPGATGSPGADGKDGATGPGPTADQVATAVTAYCSNGACVGPKGNTGDTGAAGPAGPAGANGKDGSNGADGKNAPTFTKIECTESNSWLFTLSDGTVLTAAGPCRATTITTTVTAPPSSSPAPTSTATP